MSQSKRSAKQDREVAVVMTARQWKAIEKALWLGRLLALSGNIDYDGRGRRLPAEGRAKRRDGAYQAIVRAESYVWDVDISA